MAPTSRAAVIERPGELSIREFDRPDIGPKEALLDVEMVGVCATDPKIYHGDGNYEMPIVPGHEIIGHVAEIGDAARKRYGVDEGDRVIVFPFIRCGECQACLAGNPVFCEEQRAYGTFVSSEEPPHLWGGYGEHMYVAPGSTLVPISESVPAEAGVLVSAVLGNGIRWTRVDNSSIYCEPILIQGPGPQGLAATIAADHAGASPILVTGVEGDERRLRMAERCGADCTINVSELDDSLRAEVATILDDELPMTVLDVTGNENGIQASFDTVGREGTVIVAGLLGDGVEMPVAFDDLLYRDVSVQTVLSHRVSHVEQAVKLVESGDYPFEEFVTHEFPLAEAERAIRTTAREIESDTEPIKVAIRP